MNIISLFNSFVNHLNNILNNNLFLHELEYNINNSTIEINLDILKEILEYLDLEYKNSNERKEKYYIWQTRPRTLITSLGLLTFNKTYYKSKVKNENGKYEFYSYLEDYLGIDKWAKMSLSAETILINNALDNGFSWSANNSIPNYITTRQTISKKVKSINYNLIENIKKKDTPEVLYIEADEVHANLQSKNPGTKNKIVPVILTHEGHKEDFVNKKKLKNTHYIASSILKTDKLWNEAYKYLDKKYNLEKVQYLFISGDGGSWIKGYDESFPKAIYVLDKFHYRKALNYIFKKEPLKTKMADGYLRNKMIDKFKQLVKFQCELYPTQKQKMIEHQNYLVNNIQGIINQQHPKYKCPCSMEGHISNKYARFITSRPHAYSEDGLENIVQLLTMKANNIKLTEEIYHQFKTGESTYKKLNLEKFITNFRNQSNEIINNNLKYNIKHTIDNSNFNKKENYRLDYFLSKRI